MATNTPVKPVAAKKTKAGTAVAVKPSMNIVSIQDALKAQVAALAGRVAPATGNKIRTTQDKKFVLPDGTTTPGPLELVIVDFASVHNFYDRPFKKGEESGAACYSTGLDPRNMVPDANVPVKQADTCNECPNFAFGSDGAGKACKQGRMLAVLPPDADSDTPIWLLGASVMAVKGFDSYVTGVARTFQSMPLAVVTTVGFDESVTYAKLTFGDPKPNPNLGEHFARQAEAKEMLFTERDPSSYVPIAPPTPSRKSVRR